ncbi:hypothetical protein MTR67_012548, partial [Solanum verrucosum]
QKGGGGGAGGVIQDYRGSWIAGFSAKVNVINALHSELLALFLRLRMAARVCISTIQIDIDSSDIIDIIYKGHDSFTTTIFECRELLQKLGNP